MITQFKTTREFTHKSKCGILVPIPNDTIFTYNFLTNNYQAERSCILGCWDKKIEEKIGNIIEITKEFIVKNPYFFNHVTPTIFTIDEVEKLITDLKNDVARNGNGYFLIVSTPEKVLKKFLTKNIEESSSNTGPEAKGLKIIEHL